MGEKLADIGYGSDIWYRVRKLCVRLVGYEALLAYRGEHGGSIKDLDEQQVWDIMRPACSDRDRIDLMAHEALDPDGESPVERRAYWAEKWNSIGSNAKE
jgi:hypothetical protein